MKTLYNSATYSRIDNSLDSSPSLAMFTISYTCIRYYIIRQHTIPAFHNNDYSISFTLTLSYLLSVHCTQSELLPAAVAFIRTELVGISTRFSTLLIAHDKSMEYHKIQKQVYSLLLKIDLLIPQWCYALYSH